MKMIAGHQLGAGRSDCGDKQRVSRGKPDALASDSYNKVYTADCPHMKAGGDQQGK